MARPNPLLTSGIPLILLVVGGWVGLSQFVQAKIDAQEASKSVVDDHAPVAKQRAKAFDPEAELARIKQQIDLQKPYEQVKIERPNYD